MIGQPRGNEPGWYQRLWRLYLRLRPKARAYRDWAATPEGRVMLLDLASFCCALAPAIDDRMIGRRDVWLRIMHFTVINEGELAALYANLSPEQRHQLWSTPGSPTFIEEE